MIDPRISLAAQAPNISNTLQMFNNSLNSAQNRRSNQQFNQQQAAMLPGQLAQQQQNIDINQTAINTEAENRNLISIAETIPQLRGFIASGDSLGALSFLNNRNQDLAARGRTEEERRETLEAIETVTNGNLDQLGQDLNMVEQAMSARGLSSQVQTSSAGQREFDSLVQQAEGNPDDISTQAARIKLRVEAPAGTSAAERISQSPTVTQQVAASEGQIAGARESGKLSAQLAHKPAINRAVKLAEKEATEKGEVITDLARMEASLPGIREAVAELVDLSGMATSTLGGRAFDFAVKESGFGSTKGADARAKLVAIVDNQVLPLLKETFGAAFTVQEGENLKASLVNPNASPSEKSQQLDAFLAQKERNVRTKQAQLGITPPAQQVGPVTDISTMTLEELLAERASLGGQ